jgi:hypothetical protein
VRAWRLGNFTFLVATLRHFLDNHLTDIWLVDTIGLVAFAGRIRAAHGPEFGIPRLVRMVSAHPADASADRAIRVHALDVRAIDQTRRPFM